TLYLATHDLESSSYQIYEAYQKRWCIEEYHKSIKQNATKVVRSQKNYIFASIVAYCRLELLKIETLMNHFALKYKLIRHQRSKSTLILHRIERNSSKSFPIRNYSKPKKEYG
ncbi:MAG: hypothetical protein QRY74_00255, partial [Chlamydia sp.]